MDIFWVTLLQQILVIALPTLATALTALVGAWILQKSREIGKNISVQEMQSIKWAVSIAVNAAEQANLAKLITDKKQYAIDLSQKYLAKQGIPVDVSLLEGLVEAAVKAEINTVAQGTPPTVSGNTTTTIAPAASVVTVTPVAVDAPPVPVVVATPVVTEPVVPTTPPVVLGG